MPLSTPGHCRINVARHLGPEVADQLAAWFWERSGRGAYAPYWDLVDAVGMLDDAGPDRGWLPALDDFVRRAVARID